MGNTSCIVQSFYDSDLIFRQVVEVINEAIDLGVRRGDLAIKDASLTLGLRPRQLLVQQRNRSYHQIVEIREQPCCVSHVEILTTRLVRPVSLGYYYVTVRDSH